MDDGPAVRELKIASLTPKVSHEMMVIAAALPHSTQCTKISKKIELDLFEKFYFASNRFEFVIKLT